MMNEMMKNLTSFANLDFTKNIEAFKTFDAGKISRQVLDFQKSAFDTSFDNMLKIQDDSSNMTASLMSENKFFTEEGQKMLEEWRASFRKNQLEFKKALDDNFSQFMSFLTPRTAESESKGAQASKTAK